MGDEYEPDPYPPEPSKFPDPHMYGTVLPGRSPRFKTHKTLAQAKIAVQGRSSGYSGQGRQPGGGRVMQVHAYVYEFNHNEGGWTLVKYLPKGLNIDQDEWYKTAAKSKKSVPVSEVAMDKAIASILRGKT